MTDQAMRRGRKENGNFKKSGLRILLYFYLVLILFLLLTVATYSWFSLSKLNRVSNISLYVNAPVGMQIARSHDAQDWGQQISWAELVPETSPLRPVTWSDANQRFYAAVYGMDGRMTGEWRPLSDERNANRSNYDGYYCVATFYGKTDERVKVSLAPAVATEDGRSGSGTYLIGRTLWDSGEISHYNGGFGAENAVRVGIQITRLDENGDPVAEAPLFYIYEPNSNAHADYSKGYVNTPSIDGSDTLVPESRLITQDQTLWMEADPVERGVVIYQFGAFTSDTELFIMEADETVRIRLYIWLEGQDVDCTNLINKAQIMANIQFVSVSAPQSGMEPMETESDERND